MMVEGGYLVKYEKCSEKNSFDCMHGVCTYLFKLHIRKFE